MDTGGVIHLDGGAGIRLVHSPVFRGAGLGHGASTAVRVGTTSGWSLRLRAPDRGEVRGVVDLVLGTMSVRLHERATEMSMQGLEGVGPPARAAGG